MVAQRTLGRVLALLLALGASRGASAEPVEARPTSAPRAPRTPRELRHTSAPAILLELGASLAFSSVVVLGVGPAAKHCGWCASDGFDESVRNALRAAHPRTAAGVSHAFSTAAAPALALGAVVPSAFMWGRPAHALEDTAIVLDSVILTFGITHGTKRLVDRERPAVHHGLVAETEYAHHPGEWNQSFFSQDTSIAFALGSSAATLAYLRGYPSAPWVVFAGSVIGVGTACLRVAADMHWATDVLTGAVVGTGVGFALPFLWHGRVAQQAPRALVLAPVVGRGQAGVVTVLPW
jgi:membrane-associated phospholipid phosphatase